MLKMKMKVLSHKRILYINSNQGQLQFSATTGPYHAWCLSLYWFEHFLLCVNGMEAVSTLAGWQIMDFWDRLCTGLRARLGICSQLFIGPSCQF
jgi:hypothetical protein